MTILVTNDDGISAEGLRALASELKQIAPVVVVAPDGERSAIGTAVTLRQPLRLQSISPLMPGVETYSVGGTPSDSVILGLGRLIKDKVDLVVSGINQGTNLGDDVLISGTVGAALQGYLHGFPAMAVSAQFQDDGMPFFADAARFAAMVAKKMLSSPVTPYIFLNINFPCLRLAEVKGVQITRLASASHIHIVEEGSDGNGKYYKLIRRRSDGVTDKRTDVWALSQGIISITPLFARLSDRPSPSLLRGLRSELAQELKGLAG